MQGDLKEKGIEWQRVRALPEDCGRLKALCKPSTPKGRRGLSK
jgi:hypothetical protein